METFTHTRCPVPPPGENDGPGQGKNPAGMEARHPGDTGDGAHVCGICSLPTKAARPHWEGCWQMWAGSSHRSLALDCAVLIRRWHGTGLMGGLKSLVVLFHSEVRVRKSQPLWSQPRFLSWPQPPVFLLALAAHLAQPGSSNPLWGKITENGTAFGCAIGSGQAAQEPLAIPAGKYELHPSADNSGSWDGGNSVTILHPASTFH